MPLLTACTIIKKKMAERIMAIDQEVRFAPFTIYSEHRLMSFIAYHFPNDSTEIDRLGLHHTLLKAVFHNRLHYAPLFSPKNILDIGTGTGSWAIEMGDAFPHATVQGTDLSPIQPTSVPQNVQFFIDDASEEDWAVPPAHFDYIHTRSLYGCFTSFKDIIKRAFYYTKPGGYMESQEVLSTPFCDDKSIPKNWPFLEWTQYNEQAAKKAGRPVKIAHKLKKWYEEAGFVDVQEKVIKMPMNPWPRDKKLKELGRMQERNLLEGLSAWSLAHFSRVFGWSKTEIEVSCSHS